MLTLVLGLFAFSPLPRVADHASQTRPMTATMVGSSGSSLADLTVYELKAVCRAKGLKVSGRKAELIERVSNAPPGVVADSAEGKGRGRGRGRGRGKGRGRSSSTKPPPPPPAAADVINGATISLNGPATATDASPSAPSGAPSSDGVVAPTDVVGVGVDAVVDVISTSEADELDDQAYLNQRRQQRRAKLSQYFTEEVSRSALRARAACPLQILH